MRAVVLFALACALTQAVSIKWTGIANDMQWSNHINWYPAQVPGQNDDVSIGVGVVQVTASTAVNSLTMGYDVNGVANLTLYQSFLVGNGGLSVSANGNLFINTGLSQVFATATIDGNLFFVDGTLAGSWTVGKRAYADLGNANEKGFSGCAFVSAGQLSLGGVIVLNQSSTFTIAAGATATATGALLLTGPAFIQGVTNNGVFNAQAAVSSQNINIQGSGSVSVTSILTINTATVSQAAVLLSSGSSFTGSNTFLTLGKVESVSGGAVKAVLGDYTLTCQKECDNVSTPSSTTPTASFSFSA